MRERVVDALGILDEGGTRWRVVGVTIAFPVLMLLGGALTSLGDSLLLQLLAALPALLLLGMVGAFGQFVLAVTLQGLAHIDNPPRLTELVRQAPRVLLRLAALSATFLGPGLLVVLLGHWPVGILIVLGGFLLLPVAAALLLGTGSWRALSPVLVITAIRRAGRASRIDAGVSAMLCVPALLALLLTLGQSAYTMLTVVGPLAATPALLAARMIGLTLCEHRHALAGLFPLPVVEDLAAAATLAKPAAPRARPGSAVATARPRIATRPAGARPALAARTAMQPRRGEPASGVAPRRPAPSSASGGGARPGR